jgi:hypothetical protein
MWIFGVISHMCIYMYVEIQGRRGEVKEEEEVRCPEIRSEELLLQASSSPSPPAVASEPSSGCRRAL